MKRPNLYDRLKVIAILTMIVDHIGYAFFPEISWLRVVGRIAFPIFLFLVGFNGRYEWKWNLFRFAIVVQIPIWVLSFGFGFGSPALNILFGIVISRLVLQFVNGVNLVNGVNGVNGKPSLLSFTKFTVSLIVLLTGHFWLAKLWDYGSFVVLFPLAGWMISQRSKVNKSKVSDLIRAGSGQQKGLLTIYLMICFAWLGFWTWYVFGFDPTQVMVMGGFFALLLCIFFVLGQGNYFLPVEKYFDRGLVFVSKNALLIYVFHLLVFGVIKIFLMFA